MSVLSFSQTEPNKLILTSVSKFYPLTTISVTITAAAVVYDDDYNYMNINDSEMFVS
jgi:hypothetical protein